LPKAREAIKKIKEEKKEEEKREKFATLLEKVRKGELTKKDLEKYERGE